jgi:Caspase domain
MIGLVLRLIAMSQPRLYVLAVGNGRYEDRPSHFLDKEFEAFEPLPQAERSASSVIQRLNRLGPVSSTLLSSANGETVVTKSRILKAIRQLCVQAKRQSSGSIVLVYYAGHGTSEGLTHTQYWWPGDVTQRLQDKASELANEKLIGLPEVTNLIKGYGLKSIVLSDACRAFNRKEIHDFRDHRLDGVLSKKSQSNLGNIVDVLRFEEEYHDSDPAVITAAPPGFVADTAEDPNDPTVQVAPLARRLLLAEKRWAVKKSLDINGFMQTLGAKDLDAATATVYTHFVPYGVQAAKRTILFDPSKRAVKGVPRRNHAGHL